MAERPGALARAAVLAHVEHWNACDKERWLAIFSDDVIYEDPPGTVAGRGRDVMSDYAWDRSFTDEKRWILEPVVLIACGNEAQVHMRNHGAVAGRPAWVDSIELWAVDDDGPGHVGARVLGAAGGRPRAQPPRAQRRRTSRRQRLRTRRSPRTSRVTSGSASELRLATASASAPPRMRFTGTSSFLPDSVRGTTGTVLDRVGHVARRQLGARARARSRPRRSSSKLGAGRERDEQHELAHRRCRGRRLEVHDQAVGDLGERFDHRVEVAGAEAHAAAVERGVGATGDHARAVVGEA